MNSLKRQTVLASAGATLARNPAASVADIASRAGVGRATLYRFFAKNDAIVLAAGLLCGIKRLSVSTEIFCSTTGHFQK